jgi:hypothetical protein
MKKVFMKRQGSWFVYFCLAVIVAILACNLWSLMVGNCVVYDFLRIPPMGWVMIAANIIAGMSLYFVKHRNKSVSDESCCPACCTDLRQTWDYCPNCGNKAVRGLHSTRSL